MAIHTCAMRIFHGFLVVLLSVTASPANDTPKMLGSGKVNFPLEGSVSIEAVVKQGQQPHLIFRSSSNGKVLLSAVVGKTADWKEYTDANDPNHVLSGLRFVVLHRHGLPDPLIVALAMYPGGSDCRYSMALFGEVEGEIRELTPDLPDYWFRGGAELSRRGSSGETRLIVSSEHYSANDVHVNGPSRLAVYTYKYDPAQEKFVEISHSLVRDADGTVSSPDSINLVSLFGELAQC